MSRKSYDPFKRLIDIAIALVSLIATAPIQGLLAVLVARNLGRPIFFRHTRPGKEERPFRLLKFRTMEEPSEARGLTSDAERLTSFGRKLRSTSLDELPSLWNVLVGDMSLVGPRPLLMEYLDRYTPEQRRRHEVRPGLTGLAQVNGRNSIEWSDKFTFDIAYVENRSLSVDLRIMWRTVAAVLSRKGISKPGEATMPEFMGSVQTLPLCQQGLRTGRRDRES